MANPRIRAIQREFTTNLLNHNPQANDVYRRKLERYIANQHQRAQQHALANVQRNFSDGSANQTNQNRVTGGSHGSFDQTAQHYGGFPHHEAGQGDYGGRQKGDPGFHRTPGRPYVAGLLGGSHYGNQYVGASHRHKGTGMQGGRSYGVDPGIYRGPSGTPGLPNPQLGPPTSVHRSTGNDPGFYDDLHRRQLSQQHKLIQELLRRRDQR